MTLRASSPPAQSAERPSAGSSSAPCAERAGWRAREAALRSLRRSNPRLGLVAAAGWLAEADPDSEAFAWALRAYGRGLTETAEYRQAVAYLERAAALFRALDLEVEVARTATGQVWALRYLGRYDEAVQLARNSSQVLLSHGRLLDAAQQMLNLGTVYRRMGRLEAAQRTYLQAIRGLRQAGDLTDEATATSNLGNVLADLAHYGPAERAQRRAIRLYTQLEQQAQLARVRLNLGLLLKRRGDFGRALTELNESRSLYARLGLSSGVALTDLDLAQTYLALNLLAEASTSAQQAVVGFGQLELPFELGQALVWSAAAAERSGDRAEAADSLKQAVELFSQTGNRLWEASATILSTALQAPDRRNVALVARAERRLARLGARGRAAEARLTRADLLRQLGEEVRASRLYRAVLRQAGEVGDDLLAYRAHAALGELREATAPHRASCHYRQSIRHFEALRRQARADDLKLAFVADKEPLYQRAVATLLRQRQTQRRLAEALACLERGKALGLLEDLLAQADRGRRTNVALVGRLRDARTRLAEMYEARDALAPGTFSVGQQAALKQLEADVASQTRQLQIAVRGEPEAAPFDVARLRASLPGNARALLYAMLGDELACFLVDQKGIVLRRGLSTGARLDRLLARLRFHLGKGVYGADYLESNSALLRRGLDRVLAELWSQTLAPLESDLAGATQLVVVPHGPIHGLPLHAAYDGSDYAVDRWTMSYAPSARTFSACVERRLERPTRPLFVGSATEHLPGIEREVAGLSQLCPDSQKLVGSRATAARLRRQAGRFDLLHLAAHGVFRADNPSFSALRLSDGWLSVADLAELSRGAALVTLSACETGLSAVAAGEELLGLTRAVLGGGAAALLASLWTVHDEATNLFMQRFYRRLLAGESRASSLRAAMSSVRQSYDHPHFWAPFVLSGAI
jgi:tetratricopeptide (TPR) repeat protein